MTKKTNTLPTRSQVPSTDRWHLEKIYSTIKDWEKDYQLAQKNLVKLSSFRGTLSSEKNILTAFEEIYQQQRLIEKVYVFASHLNSVDLSDSKSNIIAKKAEELFHNFSENIFYFNPELNKLSPSFLQSLVESPQFRNYRRELELVILKQKHILSDSEEKILSQSSQLFSTPYNIFKALDNVDLNYGEITTPEKKKVKLTSGLYSQFMEHSNRQFRSKVFEQYYQAYQSHIHTFAETLSGLVKQHVYFSKVKKYKNSLEAALSGNLIDPKVYTTLVQETNKTLPVLHKYFKYRAKQLKLKKLSMWDLRTNLFKAKPMHFSYDEAVQICLEALRPLGENYCKILSQGLKNGWVDKFENVGKTSGAYSGGCYDSDPYILMNFTGTLNDVFTLAHEAGHSMHSYFSHQHQPYSLADYPIFTAEIASTVNERLLTAYLLKKYSGKPEQKNIITHEIDGIRSTFYRQTMFAEFELLIHQSAEKSEPLTTDFLNKTYQELNRKYHGSILAEDPYIQYEWARIPHFYYNFYVYQYATGIAAAYYFSEQILSPKGGVKAAEKYLSFLKSGGNDFPLRQLKAAGLDFTKPEIYQAVANNLEKCLNLLETKSHK